MDSHNNKNNFKEVNDQLNTENMPCVLLQRKAFLYLMNISIPWANVGKEMFVKQTREEITYGKEKKKDLSLELFAEFQFWKNRFS